MALRELRHLTALTNLWLNGFSDKRERCDRHMKADELLSDVGRTWGFQQLTFLVAPTSLAPLLSSFQQSSTHPPRR
jgi:hypothetical protein